MDEPADRHTLTEKVRLGELFSVDCPSREVLKSVSSLWGVLCLISLRERTLRFSELRRSATGVSEKMLAQTLKRLEEDGFVLRHALETVPPHVEYSLTDLGLQVSERVVALVDWIELNTPHVMAFRRERAGP
ncbi:helix-turn-helix domain-containing protein [Caulobacter sp. RHG1]|uniref:winged helix-turn-helix transcriptional regulator n=1 Tax=Caulobacter sp. (strain RHG1) TaxID=2545762 RepID=UPI001555AC23|nr:helix-turn-helix domain-containing protein [Caulobacter sp. RHG1]NQE64297.1 Redox-sensing transcriptional regulator QorR [Caulobacter sp. RHG1]